MAPELGFKCSSRVFYILVATFNFLAVTEAEKLAKSRVEGKTYQSVSLKQNIILIRNADIANKACLSLRLESWFFCNVLLCTATWQTPIQNVTHWNAAKRRDVVTWHQISAPGAATGVQQALPRPEYDCDTFGDSGRSSPKKTLVLLGFAQIEGGLYPVSTIIEVLRTLLGVPVKKTFLYHCITCKKT